MVQLIKGLLLAGLVTVSAAKGPVVPPPTFQNSAVLDLLPSNFDEIVISGKPALVEFFAPWCGHCKSLAPAYEQLAQNFAFAKDKLVIAKVDADKEKSLGKRFGVQGFPTIKFFDGKSDKPIDYDGNRDIRSLANFLTEKTGVRPQGMKPVAGNQVQMLNDKLFEEKIGGDQNVLVAFTAPWCGHCKSLAPVWEKVSEDFINEPSVVIAKVDAEADDSKATANKQGVSSYPTIKFFPKGSKEPEPFNGGRTEADIISFLNEKTGTHRTPGGGLTAEAGTIEALDAIVEKFTGGSSISEVTAEATKAAKKLKEDAQFKYAEYYVKVFGKIAESDGYAAKELARLEKILKKGGLTSVKLDEFTSKTNILRRFTAKAAGKSEL